MKEQHLKYLTAAALVVIGLLQLTWILHTYALQRRDVKDEADHCFFEAAEVELASQCNSEISFTKLDSIFRELLEENNPSLCVSTYLVERDFSGTEILHQENNLIFGAIKTDLIPIRQGGTKYIQATIINPYKTVLARIAFPLAATIVMMVFIVYCIILQIRIIIRQNRISRLRTDFSYAMIHDMKTPLTSILMSTTVLESGSLNQKPEIQNNYFRIMKDEINYLLQLVNRILTVARMEVQEVRLEKRAVPVKPMIEDLINKFSINAMKEVEFVTQYAIDEVYADEEYLKEAISNLIDNAIKYSGEKITIEIVCESGNDDHDRISVKDNGFGISLKDQRVVFEKFERGKTTQRSSKGRATGFGLGLNYVLRVIEAHEGSVELDSMEGEYSVFMINLPKRMEKIE